MRVEEAMALVPDGWDFLLRSNKRGMFDTDGKAFFANVLHPDYVAIIAPRLTPDVNSVPAFRHYADDPAEALRLSAEDARAWIRSRN